MDKFDEKVKSLLDTLAELETVSQNMAKEGSLSAQTFSSMMVNLDNVHKDLDILLELVDFTKQEQVKVA